VEGLYLVGSSTHPGAGVPGVLLTAETTEKVVLSDLKFPRNDHLIKQEESSHELAHTS